jgi:hypothetical protein
MTVRAQTSHTHRAAHQRHAVFDAPFVCANRDCDEAVPPPPAHEQAGWAQEWSCPRCGARMFRACWAQAVPR